MTDAEDPLQLQLAALQEKHRALDAEIADLESFPYQDQLLLRRLKKEKLRLKDSIQRVLSRLIPDLDA
jgi:hypothetical protein